MPVTNHTPAAHRSTGTCRRCGYDMSGLPFDAACPECGTVLTTSRRRRLASENITLASPRYLWWLALSSTALLVSAAALIACTVVLGSSFLDQRWTIGLAAAALWAAAVWPVTAPRVESDGDYARAAHSGRVTRWASRLSQPAWFLTILLLIAAAKLEFAAIAAGGVPGPEIRSLIVAAWVIGTVGLVGLGFLGGDIAAIVFWAGDENTGERLRAATIGIVVLPPILVACYAGGFGAVFLTGLALIVALLLLLSVGYFVYGVVQLTLMALWAVNNAANAEARDLRVAQRRAAEENRLRARADRIHGSPLASTRPLSRASTRASSPDNRTIPLADDPS